MGNEILDAPFHMVLDVESVGLHGDGFAYGFQVVRGRDGETSDLKGFVTSFAQGFVDPRLCRGGQAGHDWWKESWRRPSQGTAYEFGSLWEMRECFWKHWSVWHDQGALLWADVAWPVEARFLSACVEDDPRRARNYGHAPFTAEEIAKAHWLDESGSHPVDLPIPEDADAPVGLSVVEDYDIELRRVIQSGRVRDEILALYRWWLDVYLPRWRDESTCWTLEEEEAFEAEVSERCCRLIAVRGSLWT